MSTTIAPNDITLGILAGGRASRLGGIDKAWLKRGDLPQVVRLSGRFTGEHGPVLISANRGLDRYAELAATVVPDRRPDLGPMGGLDALVAACTTPWLFTLPVDLIDMNDCLLQTLIAVSGEHGAFAQDDDGVQPLIALWRCDRLRQACAEMLAAGDLSIQALQVRLSMSPAIFTGFRFGNLNTADDLRAVGIVPGTMAS